MTTEIITSFEASKIKPNTFFAIVKSADYGREVPCLTNFVVEEGVLYRCTVKQMKEPVAGYIATSVSVDFQIVKIANKKLIIFYNGKKFVFTAPDFDVENFKSVGFQKKDYYLAVKEIQKFKKEYESYINKEYGFVWEVSEAGAKFKVRFYNGYECWYSFATSTTFYDDFIVYIKYLTKGFFADKINQLIEEMDNAYKNIKYF